ncbi:SOS response-associated peptidase family protein [Sanguibacter sp. Leaf3]|uniref:SOS response-associated peptidase family protein n=1 Tax=Sanguibacter sp. Leaf3 TaxID=1736209 RepID=UPI0009EA40C6
MAWQAQPHCIHGPGPLAADGLYAARKDEASGELALTYTIITREARDASGEVHDRMPTFLLSDL